MSKWPLDRLRTTLRYFQLALNVSQYGSLYLSGDQYMPKQKKHPDPPIKPPPKKQTPFGTDPPPPLAFVMVELVDLVEDRLTTLTNGNRLTLAVGEGRVAARTLDTGLTVGYVSEEDMPKLTGLSLQVCIIEEVRTSPDPYCMVRVK